MKDGHARPIKIAIVGGKTLPIPAIRGGAIQTLMTAILDENEVHHRLDITVITCYDTQIADVNEKYKYTKIFSVKETALDRLHVVINKAFRRVTKQKAIYRNAFMMSANRFLKKDYFDVVLYETSNLEMEQVRRHHQEYIIFHVHADYLTNQTRNIQIVGKNADMILAVSSFIENRLQEVDAFKNKTAKLMNAIDTLQASNIRWKSSRNETREKYGFKSQDVVFIYCSRLSPEKGVLELIKAIPDDDKCKLLIVGGEYFSSNRENNYVRQLYEEAEKHCNQVFFTGYIPHCEIGRFMAAADVAVVPSICNEAASLTMLEFRSAGLPSIASKVGGIPEYCSNETTLFVEYDENFIESLNSAMLTLANDKDKRRAMSAAAVRDLQDFDYKHYYDRFVELFTSISGKKGELDANTSKEN